MVKNTQFTLQMLESWTNFLLFWIIIYTLSDKAKIAKSFAKSMAFGESQAESQPNNATPTTGSVLTDSHVLMLTEDWHLHDHVLHVCQFSNKLVCAVLHLWFRLSPNLLFLAFLVFLAFLLVFKQFLAILSFFPSFPRILGVRQAEEILAFLVVFLAVFQNLKARKRRWGSFWGGWICFLLRLPSARKWLQMKIWRFYFAFAFVLWCIGNASFFTKCLFTIFVPLTPPLPTTKVMDFLLNFY